MSEVRYGSTDKRGRCRRVAGRAQGPTRVLAGGTDVLVQALARRTAGTAGQFKGIAEMMSIGPKAAAYRIGARAVMQIIEDAGFIRAWPA